MMSVNQKSNSDQNNIADSCSKRETEKERDRGRERVYPEREREFYLKRVNKNVCLYLAFIAKKRERFKLARQHTL